MTYAIKKAINKWVSDKPSNIATQAGNEMSATTDASTQFSIKITQYNIEDIPIANRMTSEPSRVNVDDLSKKVMTALLQFYTKFVSAKLNNINGRGIAETMMELSPTFFVRERVL